MSLSQTIMIGVVTFIVGIGVGWVLFYHTMAQGPTQFSKYQLKHGAKADTAMITFTVPADSIANVTSEISGDANKANMVFSVNPTTGTWIPVAPTTPSPSPMYHSCNSHTAYGWILNPGSYVIVPWADFTKTCDGSRPTTTWLQPPLTYSGSIIFHNPSTGGVINCRGDSYDFYAIHDDTHITIIMQMP